MKKHLIAAAVAGALAVPAMAQTTVYGIMDLAVRSANPDAGDSTTTMVSGSFFTSRLGFRSVEDLGGGMKAGFVLEGKVNADDGSTTLGSRERALSTSAADSVKFVLDEQTHRTQRALTHSLTLEILVTSA